MPTGVLAHGVGGRTDLPVPLWQVTWGAVVVLLISFALLGIAWRRARLEQVAQGRLLPSGMSHALAVMAWPLRALGLVLFVVTLTAALTGEDDADRNLAPVTVYVVVWVVVPIVQSLVGDLWRVLNPFETLALLIPGRPSRRRTVEVPAAWVAVGVLGAFVWLELAYHDSASPRAVGIFLLVVTVVMVGGLLSYGPTWRREADGFARLFSAIASIAPVHRDEAGRLRLRPPLAGLSCVEERRGFDAIVVVVLGSTAFDGFTRTAAWGDLAANRTGWERTAVATIGLVWVIGVVAVTYHSAVRWTARVLDRPSDEVARHYAGTLIPIVLGYAIAHYFSLLVFEGQAFFHRLSDPYGRGWDLFGTADGRVDYLVVSTATIATVQVLAVVLGHVGGVVLAHDRAMGDASKQSAQRSQWGLLAVMVGYTVMGLLLLLGT